MPFLGFKKTAGNMRGPLAHRLEQFRAKMGKFGTKSIKPEDAAQQPGGGTRPMRRGWLGAVRKLQHKDEANARPEAKPKDQGPNGPVQE